MSDRNKNITNFLTGIFRYKRNELSGKERNSLEREFQRDPFAEEAAEGFESVSEEEALSDINALRKKLKIRTAGNKRIILYRVAAAVTVLTLLSALFVYIEKDKNVSQLAINTINIPEAEILKSPPPAPQVRKDTESPQPQTQLREKSQLVITDNEVKTDKKEKAAEELNVIDYKSVGAVSSEAAKPPEVNLTKKQMYIPVSPTVSANSSSTYLAKGKVVSSEDNMPVPGANVSIKGTAKGVLTDAAGNFALTIPDSAGNTLIADYIGMQSKEFEAKQGKQLEVKLDPSFEALNEVVVVTYADEKDKTDKGNEGIDHTTPVPVNGRSEFNKYVQQNLHRPDSLSSGQRVVVVINFTIHKDGHIDSIRIVRSPGKPFSDEAIRVLKSGPEWKPATDNGKPVDDEVRLRFVFK